MRGRPYFKGLDLCVPDSGESHANSPSMNADVTTQCSQDSDRLHQASCSKELSSCINDLQSDRHQNSDSTEPTNENLSSHCADGRDQSPSFLCGNGIRVSSDTTVMPTLAHQPHRALSITTYRVFDTWIDEFGAFQETVFLSPNQQ